MGEKRKQFKDNQPKGPKDKSEKPGQMKQNNPEIAALISQMDAIHSSIKTLHEQFKDCKKASIEKNKNKEKK
jgi:hypothetical protein